MAHYFKLYLEEFELCSFPKDGISYKATLKLFACDKLEVGETIIFSIEMKENKENNVGKNIVGKRRKCRLPAFSPFSHNIFKRLLCQVP